MSPKRTKEEEDYFAKVEEEKIRDQGDQAARARTTAQAEELRLAHWMRCPKCGNELTEILFRTVRIDQCGWCGGVFLDRGEFTALAGKEEGMLKAVLEVLLPPRR